MSDPIVLRTIAVPHEMDMNSCVDVQIKIYQYLSRGQCHILLNLSETEYVNVNGWLTLATTRDKLRAYGGDLKIWGANEHCVNLCKLAGMINRIKFYQSDETAMRAFRGLN